MAQLKDLIVSGAARVLGKLYASEFVGKLTGNADTSTKATQDSAGQQINTTYIKGLSVNGKTITYTKGNNTTGTITTQDTNTWRPLGTTADTACAGNDSRLSNSRPASDVYAWAKAQNKPSYSWNEITSKPSTFTPSSHTHDDRYYTETEINNKLARYLPVSGGTIDGTAIISWPDSGNWGNNNKGVTFPVTRGGLQWDGQSDYVKLFTQETASDNLELVLQFGDDDSNGLSIRNAVGKQTARITASGGFTGTFYGNLSGNATTATTLQTARTINGTAFNGSGNITTANWGTARTITVGNTGKSVNGSGNVSWSLGEIGVHVSNKEPAASDGKNGDVWIVYEG